ncbi:putative protein BRICK1 [Dermatophagoides farinae]|uniref:Uncharacterized protein n=1 Tax=Dermatophagoides farinae TaxID=6954 RepID=A0A922I587_DERFA|nr:probable protein BRICK1-B [Dermatophagoides farinae]KAH7637424.1 hypothetical protein HUG17_7630 [Dermatophagoides farinae]KAH9521473.1 putative protein BRICK1 [Dermatophagoides farinae]
MAAFPKEPINKTIQQDWANREYIEIITGSIKKIADFLNSFDRSCRGRLAELNEKLTSLERSIEHFEAKVGNSELVANQQQPQQQSNSNVNTTMIATNKPV